MFMTADQQRYLRDEFHGLTLSATVRRAKIYAPNISEQQHSPFQSGLRRELELISEHYDREVRDETHLGHIDRLASSLSQQYSAVLRGGRFRIGPAQKALNLFLKYLWCAGLIPMPPHCPFDSRVIAKFPAPDQLNWTELDDIEAYARLVTVARAVAGTLPLAEWELRVYNTVSTAAARGT